MSPNFLMKVCNHHQRVEKNSSYFINLKTFMNVPLIKFFLICRRWKHADRFRTFRTLSGVNNTNILRPAILYKNWNRTALLYLQSRFKCFWHNEISKKAAHKMLVKLTTCLKSPTFYEQLFYKKNCHWSQFTFRICVFGQNNIGKKQVLKYCWHWLQIGQRFKKRLPDLMGGSFQTGTFQFRHTHKVLWVVRKWRHRHLKTFGKGFNDCVTIALEL
jgi:hypothetical protein